MSHISKSLFPRGPDTMNSWLKTGDPLTLLMHDEASESCFFFLSDTKTSEQIFRKILTISRSSVCHYETQQPDTNSLLHVIKQTVQTDSGKSRSTVQLLYSSKVIDYRLWHRLWILLMWRELQLALSTNVLQRETFYSDTLSTCHSL